MEVITGFLDLWVTLSLKGEGKKTQKKNTLS